MEYPERLKFAKADNPSVRQLAKIAKIYHEQLDAEAFQEEHPGKTIIADRCVYDCIAYCRAFTKLGWQTEEELKKQEMLVSLLFTEMPERVIIVNPPLEEIILHLQKRWSEGKKKWREEDFGYLKAVRQEFELLHSQTPCLYLNHNYTIEKGAELAREYAEQQYVASIFKILDDKAERAMFPQGATPHNAHRCL